VLASRARRVTAGMLTAAALTLSEFVDKGRLA
jgi:malic enzyme